MGSNRSYGLGVVRFFKIEFSVYNFVTKISDLLKRLTLQRRACRTILGHEFQSNRSKAAKHNHCVQNVKTVIFCTEFNKSISDSLGLTASPSPPGWSPSLSPSP